MNASKLSEWMQIIGLFAVVLSLIFVGLEMRQTQEIARATLYQMRSDSGRELSSVMIENESAREVFLRAVSDGAQSLSAPDAMQYVIMCESVLGHFENSHHLYTLGFLADEQWEADRHQLSQVIGGLCRQAWTQDTKVSLRASFAAEIDNILESRE